MDLYITLVVLIVLFYLFIVLLIFSLASFMRAKLSEEEESEQDTLNVDTSTQLESQFYQSMWDNAHPNTDNF